MEKEKHIEIGAALSPPPSPEDAGRTETSKHTRVWIVINIIATVAIVSVSPTEMRYYSSYTAMKRKERARESH